MSALDDLRVSVAFARAALLAFDTCHCPMELGGCIHAIELECADGRVTDAARVYLAALDGTPPS